MRSENSPENSEATLQLLGADAREGEEKAIVTEGLGRGLCNPGCFPRGLGSTQSPTHVPQGAGRDEGVGLKP